MASPVCNAATFLPAAGLMALVGIEPRDDDGGVNAARWTAAAGCLGALGYGALKAIWAFGGTIGVDHPEQMRAAGTSTVGWVIENLGTVGLAALAAMILLALVMPWGARLPRGIVRTLGWLGTVMVIPGALGLVEILDYIAATHLFRGVGLGGISPGTFVFVYTCFLTLGLSFATTTFLTSKSSTRAARPKSPDTVSVSGHRL